MSQRRIPEKNHKAAMAQALRLATRRDFHAVVRAQGEWLDRFCAAHPARERWCPAGVSVLRVEDSRTLLDHLPHREGDRWSAVLAGDGEVDAYVLCRTDEAGKQLSIEGHYPRVSPRSPLDQAGSRLLEFVIRRAAEQGLRRVGMFFHGFPDEVDPLVSLYRKHGFELGRGEPRLEMLSRKLAIDPGARRLGFRSAEEVGAELLCEVEARIQDCSAEKTKENLEFSRKMWSVPDADWLAACESDNVVGIVRMGVTREGVGVVDAFGLLREYRGRGLGRSLLAGGLSRLVGKAEIVWADVDCSNTAALRVCRRAGFRVHHHYGSLSLAL